MSTNIPSFRLAFETQIANLPPDVQRVHRTTLNALTDIYESLPIFKSQIDENKTAITTATAAVNSSTASETIISVASTAGFLNNQTGNTAYTTVPSDAGAYILFSDASPVAVTLSTLGSGGGIVLPFYCTIFNEGVGLVTVTPADGTISFPNNLAAGSMPVSQGQAAVIIYDGANFFAVTVCVPPQDTPLITHEVLVAYDALTGVFTQAQLAFSDLSGQIDPATQMPASGVTAGSYTLASITVDAEGLVTAASSGPTGLSVTITTAQLTPTGTQGSQTFVDGILTAQVQAT